MLLVLAAAALLRFNTGTAEEFAPLADVQEVISGYQAQTSAIHQRAVQEAHAVRQRTIAQLQALQDKYCRNAQLDEAIAVRDLIRRLQAEQAASANVIMPPTPAAVESTCPSPSLLRGRIGESFICRITGSTSGTVWGTDVYTDDSDVATAAVHAGVLASGQTGLVKVTIVPPQSGYLSTSRNGVTSYSWGEWPGSFRVESADGAGATVSIPREMPHPDMLMSLATAPGQTFVFTVTGTTDGYLWGNEIYTTDSRLSTAAVHTGVLQPGQTGRIRVTILPGRHSYPGVNRHGVASHSWGSYPLSYNLRRE